MARIPTLVCSFLLFVVAQAQVTITDNEMPHAGDELSRTRANTNPFLDYATTGPDHIWDFSNLSAASEDLAAYQTVGSTNFVYALVYVDFFLNPNRANHVRPGVDIPFNELLPIDNPYTFYYRSSSVYKKVGYGVELAGIPVPIIYNEHDVIYNLPLDYGDIDVSSSSYEVSIPTLAHYGYEQERENEVDGWGSITTPSGTFDALRVKTTLAGRDTINLDTLGIGFTIDRPLVREYKWLAPDLRVPVLQVNTTELFGFEVITDIWFYDLPHTINVVAPLAQTLCPGSDVVVNYEATGAYNEGNFFIQPNDFVVQLSDANGDFTNPVDIGSVEATVSGSITVTIPQNTPLGTGYRIRVISTSPDFIGADNGFDITISDEAPVASATADGPVVFCEGGSVTLNANSGQGVAYQWLLDGTTINGANGPALEVTASGSYTVEVSNACGTDVSDAIAVTVGEAPVHTPDQTAYLSCDGTPVTITTQNNSGQTDLEYQWYLNGSEVGGANAQDLLAAEAGDYSLEVMNTITGCIYTAGPVSVVLEFIAAPVVSPDGPTTFCAGGSVLLSTPAVQGLSYQWSVDGNLIDGATDPDLLADAAGDYTVVVTSQAGCASAPSAATSVVVNEAPPAPSITVIGDDTFCAGGSATLESDLADSYQWNQAGNDLAGETAQQLVVSASGVYGVTVTNAGGCTASSTANVSITVNALPDAPVVSQSGDSLLATGSGAFQWYQDGNLIPGATDNYLLPTESGEYTVSFTDGNGCTSTSEVFVFISTAVEESTSASITVHPNPSNGLFVLTLPEQLRATASYELSDATGKLLWRGAITGTTTRVDMRAAGAGLYFVQVRNGGETFTARIVVD